MLFPSRQFTLIDFKQTSFLSHISKELMPQNPDQPFENQFPDSSCKYAYSPCASMSTPTQSCREANEKFTNDDEPTPFLGLLFSTPTTFCIPNRLTFETLRARCVSTSHRHHSHPDHPRMLDPTSLSPMQSRYNRTQSPAVFWSADPSCHVACIDPTP